MGLAADARAVDPWPEPRPEGLVHWSGRLPGWYPTIHVGKPQQSTRYGPRDMPGAVPGRPPRISATVAPAAVLERAPAAVPLQAERALPRRHSDQRVSAAGPLGQAEEGRRPMASPGRPGAVDRGSEAAEAAAGERAP
eukprot:3844579-Alexandrium_andersonii.AAC.1